MNQPLIFRTAGDRYEVVGTDCCLMSSECMRIDAYGNVVIGQANYPIERYRFKSPEVAGICADIFNRDLDRQRFEPIRLTAGDLRVGNSNFDWLKVQDRTREIIRMDQNGVIVKLDLPYLVWCWIRTSAAGNLVNALWNGWGK